MIKKIKENFKNKSILEKIWFILKTLLLTGSIILILNISYTMIDPICRYKVSKIDQKYTQNIVEFFKKNNNSKLKLLTREESFELLPKTKCDFSDYSYSVRIDRGWDDKINKILTVKFRCKNLGVNVKMIQREGYFNDIDVYFGRKDFIYLGSRGGGSQEQISIDENLQIQKERECGVSLLWGP